LHRGNFIPRGPLPQLEAKIVEECLSRFSDKRAIRKLKTLGYLASPLVPKRFERYITIHDRFYYLNKIDQLLPKSKRSEKIRVSFEVFSTFYNAVRLYWKGYERPQQIDKHIQLLKVRFLVQPDHFCVELKELFNSFRSEVFSRKPRIHSELNFFFPEGVSDFNKLSASSCMRALPAFTGSQSHLIDETIKRWTEPGRSYDLSQIKSWLDNWVRYYRPKDLPDFYPITIGTRACLEYSRLTGGIRKRTIDLMTHVLSKEMQVRFDKEILRIKRISLGSIELDPYRQSNHLIYSCLDVLQPAISHTDHCKEDCNLPSSHPPMACLAVRFRGYKTRIPTMTIAPIVILSKILRQVADGYLRSDPRIRPSLEGVQHDILNLPSKGLYRSQDIRIATDYHEVEMTRYFYQLINPGVDWWSDAVKVVCNKYTILSESDILPYRVTRSFPDYGWFDKPLEHYFEDKFFKSFYDKFYQDGHEKMFCEFVPLTWDKSHSKVGKVTRRGQPMGISTSWVMLPLVSLYSFESSSEYEKITITRKVFPKTENNFDPLSLSRAFKKERKLIEISNEVPKDYLSILTTGDDAIFKATLERSERHTLLLNSVGSEISINKDYLSASYALYTELYYLDGYLMPIYPMGFLLAPEQSSGQCTWYSQPKIIKDNIKRFKTRINWKYSPYYHIWKVLIELGIPVGAPSILGGLELSNAPYKSRFRLGYRVKLLCLEEFNNLLRLHPSLPKLDPAKDGLMEVPSNPKNKTREELLTFYSGTGVKKDIKGNYPTMNKSMALSKRTESVPSPLITIPYKTYDSIYRSSLTWDQFYRTLPDSEEPSIISYCEQFTYKYYIPFDIIVATLEEFRSEMESTISIPSGSYLRFRPTFGLLLPRAQCPMFYFNDRSKELRTHSIFYSEL